MTMAALSPTSRKPRFIAGGPEEVPEDQQPMRLRFECAAHSCPMPGSVFLGGPGVCGWHARENPDDWPKITQAILDWRCVSRVINRARQVLTAPETCSSAKAQDDAMQALWTQLRADLNGSGGWESRLEPRMGPGRYTGEGLSNWSRRLDQFLGARVRERIFGGSVDERAPTQFAAEVTTELRDVPRGTQP